MLMGREVGTLNRLAGVRGCLDWSPSEGLLLWVKMLTSSFLRGGFVCYPAPSSIRVDRGGLLKSGGILKA